MTTLAELASLPEPAIGLLSQLATPVDGLYRRHQDRNLAAVGDAILASYHDSGPIRLGPQPGLVVIAVDGLGYRPALTTLTSAELTPLSSEFPTTTVACLMTSVTREPAFRHGFIGVQYLHADGQQLVNCHDGRTSGRVESAAAKPTTTPMLSTIFDTLTAAHREVVVLPNELGWLQPDVRDRLFHGAQLAGPALPVIADPAGLVAAFAEQVTAAVATRPGALIWTYLDLDRHIHRYGFDQRAATAMTALDALAQRLRDGGTSVLVFSDHGLARCAPSPATTSTWQAASSERYCRLPPGGAGRVRWLYPQPAHADRLASQLARQLPDAVVLSSDQLAELGFVAAGSIGQRRLGEIILIATGADFPVPDAGVAYEHGSMTAEEVLVPMAIWSAVR
jgi:type I phosphodiesterase/nucleotide pyrophosphatase